MSSLSWKARFAPRADERAGSRVPSGSPVILSLRLDPNAEAIDSIAAIEALVRRHTPLLKAKRAIEAVLARGRNHIHVPMVEDHSALRSDLAASGLIARVTDLPGKPLDAKPIDVKQLRERLGETQEQFAARFRISLDVLRNWEQHRNTPDPIARNVLEMIDRDPIMAEEALWGSA